jgi:hypothetical protein
VQQLQLFSAATAIVRSDFCRCSIKHLQLMAQTTAVDTHPIAVFRPNNCRCSTTQLHLFNKPLHVFVEFFDEPTGVFRTNNCSCSMQLLPMFDKTCAVVCSNDCNCSLQELQLIGRATNCSYSLNCCYETIADVQRKNSSCSVSGSVKPCSCSMKQLPLFGEPSADVR